MEAGHGGRSGRYDAWLEEALVLAWIITYGPPVKGYSTNSALTDSPSWMRLMASARAGATDRTRSFG